PPTITPPTFRPPTVPGTFTGVRPGGANIGTLPGGFGTRLPGGFTGIPTRTPAQLHGEVRGLITTRPAGALPKLGTPEARLLLPEATRLALGKEAVERLAIQVEGGGNPAKDLAGGRGARRAAGDLPAQARAPLGRRG